MFSSLMQVFKSQHGNWSGSRQFDQTSKRSVTCKIFLWMQYSRNKTQLSKMFVPQLIILSWPFKHTTYWEACIFTFRHISEVFSMNVWEVFKAECTDRFYLHPRRMSLMEVERAVSTTGVYLRRRKRGEKITYYLSCRETLNPNPLYISSTHDTEQRTCSCLTL